jgi:hypothetical protein
VDLIDPSAFFAAMFGSAPFEYLVGELKLAGVLTHVDATELPDDRFTAYMQRRREVKCAVTLRGMLSQYVAGERMLPVA